MLYVILCSDIYLTFVLILLTSYIGYKPSRAPGHAELPPQYTLDSLQKVLAEQNITNIEEKAKTDLVS